MPEDRGREGIDNIRAALSEIEHCAQSIARQTDDPGIIDRVERIRGAVQRGRNYASALDELRKIEQQTRKLFLGEDYYKGTEYER